MRYKDIADVRNRGRRESFGLRNRIKANDLLFNKDGTVALSTNGRKAQRPMSQRWLFAITRASHPIARLWRKFFDKKIKPINEARKLAKKAPIKAVGPARINAKFPGWKSFKKRAHVEGNAKIARAMAR